MNIKTHPFMALLTGFFLLIGCESNTSSSEPVTALGASAQEIAEAESTETQFVENEAQPGEEGGALPAEGGGDEAGSFPSEEGGEASTEDEGEGITEEGGDGPRGEGREGVGEDGFALINVYPMVVDFENVQASETREEEILILNEGTSNLLISSMDFYGPSVFSVRIDDMEFPVGLIDFSDAPLVIPAGGSLAFFAQFSPENPDPATGVIKIYSNASNSEVGPTEVILEGNTSGPKITIQPSTVEFGSTLVGESKVLPVTIQSSGTDTLVIHAIELEEGSSTAFELEYTELPGYENGSKPSVENPLILGINQTAEFQVRFSPEKVSEEDADSQAIPELAKITIQNNSFHPVKEVEVQGFGMGTTCPVAVLVIEEGEQVIPQTELTLFGDQSFAPSGSINKWEWTVQQPTGSQSLFIPSENFPNPKFEANVAGSYEFQLMVYDDQNNPSCEPDTATVMVIPDEAIHVELLWNTPNDPNQADEGPEAGTDLDLHFTHPLASGADVDQNGFPDGWFDQPFDCFWFNPNPNWASFGPGQDDDPSLDRDDTDGAGPENLNLNVPENDATYKVGVHYWNDHNYGPSYATIRVYIYAELVYTLEDVKLLHQDMWEVCTIDWPSGTVNPVGDGYTILPDYQNPFFFNP